MTFQRNVDKWKILGDSRLVEGGWKNPVIYKLKISRLISLKS